MSLLDKVRIPGSNAVEVIRRVVLRSLLWIYLYWNERTSFKDRSVLLSAL